MSRVTARFPVVPAGNQSQYVATIVVGSAVHPEVVSLFIERTKHIHEDLRVVSQDPCRIDEVSKEVLGWFGIEGTQGLITGLSRAYGTALPGRIVVTVLVLEFPQI